MAQMSRMMLNRGTGLGLAAAMGFLAGWGTERIVMRRLRAGTETRPALHDLETDLTHRRQICADGAELHWVERGVGPAVIMLHGITLDATAWRHQLACDDVGRMMAVDLIGHGESVPGSGGGSISANAMALAELIESEDLDDVTLVGHSMGGMVIGHFLAHASEETVAKVHAVIFVDSAIRFPASPRAGQSSLHPRLQRPRWSRWIGTVPDNDLGWLAVRSTFGHRPDTADIERLARSFDRLSPEVYWQAWPSIVRHDIREGLSARVRRHDLRVVVAVGSLDRLTPVRAAQELRDAFVGAELVIVEGVGHQLMMERPREFNDLLRRVVHGIKEDPEDSR